AGCTRSALPQSAWPVSPRGRIYPKWSDTGRVCPWIAVSIGPWICGVSMTAAIGFTPPPVTASGGRHVDHPPHPHQDRSVRDRKRHTDLEDAMRFAHDPAKGLRFGKALA